MASKNLGPDLVGPPSLDFGVGLDKKSWQFVLDTPQGLSYRMETLNLDSGFRFYLSEVNCPSSFDVEILNLSGSKGFGFCLCGDMYVEGYPNSDNILIKSGQMAIFITPPYEKYIEKLTESKLVRISVSCPDRHVGCFDDYSDCESIFADTLFFNNNNPFLDTIYFPNEVNEILGDILNCHYVGPMRRLFLEAKALELLICSVREFFGQPSDTARKSASVCRRDADKAHEAADLLVRDFYSVPSMDDLSRAVGMSRSKLNHVFKEVHGTTPFAFLRNHRLAKARELLLEEQVNVTEAALAVGYSSLSHFTKAFAGQFNCCPSDCRNPRGRAG